MAKDPGLFTDSTGEGMAGAEDVSLATQRELNRTVYNGESTCTSCGTAIDPVQSMFNKDTCPSCKRKEQYNLLKRGMIK
jgi:Zn finger protein HypA/HybF involved in hydrogenase expression